MSSTNIQQALSSLLPTLNGILPPELVNLSTSLLAQSRTSAANLKTEEEIARPYACAEIACKRLQSRLRLPNTHGHPPCAPRVYKKLLAFLEGSLLARAIGRRKDGGSREGLSLSSPAKAAAVPKKNAIAGGAIRGRSPASTPAATPKKVAFAGKAGAPRTSHTRDQADAPEWIMPFIRRLCATFSSPLLPPHVYTGVCVVLKLSGLWPPSAQTFSTDEANKDHLRRTAAALTIAVYFMALGRIQQGRVTPQLYIERCNRAVDAASGVGIAEVTKDAVDDWIKKMNREDWCRGQDWWGNVPEDVMSPEGEVETDEVDELAVVDDVIGRTQKRRRALEKEEQEDDGNEEFLLPGLGTMMQEAVDWLSEERNLDYLEWKREILGRVKHIEKGRGRAISVR